MNKLIRMTILITTLAVGLPSLAYASPISYDFTASGFTSNSGYYAPPQDPVSGSFTLDGTNLTSFSMTIGSTTYDLGNVGTDTTYYPSNLAIGGTLNGAGTEVWGTDDFLFNILQNQNGTWSPVDFNYSVSTINDNFHTYNVSMSTVPVPAAAWLFCSGFLGLIGVARRKVRT